MAKLTFLCENEDRFVFDFNDVYTNIDNFIKYSNCPVCGGKILCLLTDKSKQNILIYLCGPITGEGDFFNNINTAIEYATKLIEEGYRVYIPHLDYLLALHRPEIKKKLFDNSWEMLKRSDWVCVLPTYTGKGEGSKKEIDYCKRASKPLFYLRVRNGTITFESKKD